jgi:predicted flavoprotein YhiN
LAANEPKKALKNVLKGTIQERLLSLLLQKASLAEDLTCHIIPKQPWLEFIKLLKVFPVTVNGTLYIEEAFTTGYTAGKNAAQL